MGLFCMGNKVKPARKHQGDSGGGGAGGGGGGVGPRTFSAHVLSVDPKLNMFSGKVAHPVGSVANTTSVVDISSTVKLLGIEPKKAVSDIANIKLAFKAANLDVDVGFKLDSWQEAFQPKGALEKAICDTRDNPDDCLSSMLDTDQLFIVMDVDDDDQVDPEDIIPIVRMLSLLKVENPGKIETTRAVSLGEFVERTRRPGGKRNYKFIEDLTGFFKNQSLVDDPDSMKAMKLEDVKKIPTNAEFLEVLKANGNLSLSEAITSDEKGELFGTLLDVDNDHYIRDSDFVPCVRALTRMRFAAQGGDAAQDVAARAAAKSGSGSQAMLSLAAFLINCLPLQVMAVFHLQF